MPDKTELVSLAERMVDLYRDVAGQTPTPEDIDTVGLALGRAPAALEDQQATRETLEHAALDLEAARATMARIRQALDR
jgi:hypothetical protein